MLDETLDELLWLARQIAEQDVAMLAALLTGMRSDPNLARRSEETLFIRRLIACSWR